MQDVLTAMIKAHEIQGVLALENSYNRVGLDHVVLVKVATTAVVTRMLGGSREEVINAVSNAWIDGQSLRTYRHSPTRAHVNPGQPATRPHGGSAQPHGAEGRDGLSFGPDGKDLGFYDVLFKGNEFKFQRLYGSYVMEHVLFKISFPRNSIPRQPWNAP